MLLRSIICFVMLISWLPSGETASWAIALGVSVLLVWRRSHELALPRDLVSLLIFPCLLFGVNLHGVYTHPPAEFLKDCWYFSLPIVSISFGYLAYERIGDWRRLIPPIGFAGICVSLYLLVHVALNRAEFSAAGSLYEYRLLAGLGSFIPLLPIILLLLSRRVQLPGRGAERWRMLRVPIYMVCTAGTLVTFSRTHMISLLAGLACSANYKSILRKLFQGGVSLSLVLMGLAGGIYYIAQAKSGPLELFVSHTLQSSSEVSIRAYDTFAEINNNWRGFEAYRAEKTFAGYPVAEKLFGGGGGALVDLGFAMELSTSTRNSNAPTEFFRYIPILHNGYLYILIKTGIFGLCLFALFISQLLMLSVRALRLRDPQASFAGLALLWTAIVILFTQGVITGIYNRGELTPILFLAGASVATYSQRRKVLEGAPGAARLGLPRAAIAAGD